MASAVHQEEGISANAAVLIFVLVLILGSAAIFYRYGAGFQTTGVANENLSATVGNQGNPNLAWNSTPTYGMFSETTAPAAPNRPTQYSDSQIGGGLEDPVARCAVPTGFLAAMVNAWSTGKRNGVVSQDGIPELDMGFEGAWYDASGLGCCDTYCRKVTKGGYWSCIDPQTVATQYKASKPRGIMCPGNYGQRLPLVDEA